MNKWMVRFWGFIALAALAALLATSAWPQTGPPDGARSMRRYPPVAPNPKLALEALLGFTRSPEERFAQQAVDRAHRRLREQEDDEPEALRGADVILRRGYNAGEVEALLTRHELGFASLEAKTPVSDGTVMTIWRTQFGPMPRIPGSIAEQVERNLGGMRMQFLRRAQLDGDIEQSRRAREIATSPELGVYRVEVWGRVHSLVQLLAEPDVRGVLADTNGLRAQGFEQASREMAAQPIIRGIRVPRSEPPWL